MNMPISQGTKQYSLGTSPFKSNPFDSDSESEVSSRPSRASSVPAQQKTQSKISLFNYNEDGGRGAYSASSVYSTSAAANNRYRKDFDNQSVQELENYAVHRAEETTQKVNDCVKVAEVIREDATQTLITLHRQGEQIMRTHQAAADVERDLSMSEKLLGSLGGFFSKTWRPKKSRHIKGPAISQDTSFARPANNMEQRQRLGISPAPQDWPNPVQHSPANAMEKVQVEKAKQDDALSDLSTLLGELKDMAVDMGTEIGKQNRALDTFHDDVDELNFRVKGANQRGQQLLGK